MKASKLMHLLETKVEPSEELEVIIVSKSDGLVHIIDVKDNANKMIKALKLFAK